MTRTTTPATGTDESKRRQHAIRQMEQMSASVVTCGQSVDEIPTELLETIVELLGQSREEQEADSAAREVEPDEAERGVQPHPVPIPRSGRWRRLVGRRARTNR
ncbi:hypothetical protein ACPC54_18525 [Kitasatospora sp. NPDC094028]